MATLEDVLATGRGSTAWPAALEAVARQLDTMHSRAGVHGDVRTATITLDPRGGAQLAAPNGGTAPSLAPEVLLGGQGGPAADRFAFAVVLYTCICGVPPFADEAAARRYAEGGPPPRPSAVEPGLPRGLDDLFARALAREPGARPASAAELLHAARGLLGLGVPASSSAPRGRGTLIALGALAATGWAVAAIALLTGGDDGDATTSGVPPLPEGAVALGSTLKGDGPVSTLGCEGTTDATRADCSILQTRLPGRPLAATRDGSIRGWTVVGARGDLKLQVFRPTARGYTQVFVSQPEFVPDTAPHHYDANMAVKRGDVVAVLLARNAAIGVRRDVRGAGTRRFVPPNAGDRPRTGDLREGSGMDGELLVRLDYRPGVPIAMPRQITGAAAASAPAGRQISSIALRLGATTALSAVEVDDRIHLDLFAGRVRTARIEVPGATASGVLEGLHGKDYGNGRGEAGIEWDVPGNPRPIGHYYGVSNGRFSFIN